jgi:hypothetical protein
VNQPPIPTHEVGFSRETDGRRFASSDPKAFPVESPSEGLPSPIVGIRESQKISGIGSEIPNSFCSSHNDTSRSSVSVGGR